MVNVNGFRVYYAYSVLFSNISPIFSSFLEIQLQELIFWVIYLHNILEIESKMKFSVSWQNIMNNSRLNSNMNLLLKRKC